MAALSVAQAALPCQLCDNQIIKWKCDHCGILMCNTCKENIHPRFKSAIDHKIVFIQNIGQALGLENKSSSQEHVSSEVVSSIITTYTTNVNAIARLLCCGDNVIYYACNVGNPKVVKANLLKSSIGILQTLNRKCFDITLDKNGGVIFDTFDDMQLHILLPSGEDQEILDTYPMRLLALHANNDELIVGLREEGPPFPVRDFSVRQIVVLGTDFKRKVTIERDSKGNRLLSYAGRISTDSKNNIYVADWQNEDLIGRILAVNRAGHVQFTYYGHCQFDAFVPYGVAVTPNDNIVVTDYRNNALHVLSSRGDLLALQDVAKINIIRPASLCIDYKGFLVIGCGSQNNDAKIHVVKMLQCFM